MFGDYQLFILADIFAYLIIIALLWRTQKIGNSCYNNKRRYYISVILFFFICIYAYFDTDYFHYRDIVHTIAYGYNRSNIEDIYIEIVQLVDANYFLFRLLIWGTAIILSLWLAKVSRLYLPLFLFIFVGLFVSKFAYARVSLAMALAFSAIPLLFREERTSLIKVILGICLLSSSVIFHKTAFFAILIILVASLTINMGKKKLNLYLLLFPVFILLVDNIVLPYIFSDGESLNKYIDIESAQGYMKASKISGRGIGIIIANILERTPYYLVVLLYVKLIYRKQLNQFPIHIKMFANVTFYIVTISTIFLFITSVNTSILYYRFLYFSIIPGAAFLTYCIQNKISYKFARSIVLIGVLGSVYLFAYRFYLSFFEVNF